jgi:hypothetical protein
MPLNRPPMLWKRTLRLGESECYTPLMITNGCVDISTQKQPKSRPSLLVRRGMYNGCSLDGANACLDGSASSSLLLFSSLSRLSLLSMSLRATLAEAAARITTAAQASSLSRHKELLRPPPHQHLLLFVSNLSSTSYSSRPTEILFCL